MDTTSTSGEVKITHASVVQTQTTDTDFGSFSKTNAYVSGSGASASLIMFKPAGATCSAGTECLSGYCSASACFALCDSTAVVGTSCAFGGVPYGFVTGADGKIWMDRNLGATRVATASNDQASYQGSGGYYWSSSVSGINGLSLYLNSLIIYTANPNYRAYGFSVRCLKN